VKIKNLNKDIIKSVLNTVIDRKHTYNLCIALLSKVFNFSIENNLIKENFVKNVKKIKVNHIIRFLSKEEFDSLMNVLNTEEYSGTDIKLLVMLGLTTGLRSCNLKTIKISDINLDLGEIYVELTKNGTPVIVPISNLVKELIEEKIAKINGSSIYLFPGRLNNKHIVDFKGSFKVLLEKAGITERFRIHDMRHTFASILAKNGATLQTIQKALNHKSIHMTMKYAHLCDKDVRNNILTVINSNF
jgi:integrase